MPVGGIHPLLLGSNRHNLKLNQDFSFVASASVIKNYPFLISLIVQT